MRPWRQEGLLAGGRPMRAFMRSLCPDTAHTPSHRRIPANRCASRSPPSILCTQYVDQYGDPFAAHTAAAPEEASSSGGGAGDDAGGAGEAFMFLGEDGVQYVAYPGAPPLRACVRALAHTWLRGWRACTCACVPHP